MRRRGTGRRHDTSGRHADTRRYDTRGRRVCSHYRLVDRPGFTSLTGFRTKNAGAAIHRNGGDGLISEMFPDRVGDVVVE